MSARIDLIGKRFGLWVVVSFAGHKKLKSWWNCRCDCGVEREVSAQGLRDGLTKSCGCNKPAAISKAMTLHGNSLHPERSVEYRAWRSMRVRCSPRNKNMFRLYAGRGIKVCRRWDTYELFLLDMGRMPKVGMSLDRINNDGNYEPENCRWADCAMQGQNRRPYSRWDIDEN